MSDLHKAAVNWTRTAKDAAGSSYAASRGSWSFTIYAPTGGQAVLNASLDGVPVRSEAVGSLRATKDAAVGMLSAAQSMAWNRTRQADRQVCLSSYDGVQFAITLQDGLHHATVVMGDQVVALGADAQLSGAKRIVADLVDKQYPPKVWVPLTKSAAGGYCPHCAHCNG